LHLAKTRGIPSTLAVAVLLSGGPVQAQAPMDLLGIGLWDVNGIVRNPRWGLQQTIPGSIPDPVQLCIPLPGRFSNPACTVQATTLDTASWVNGLICSIGSTTPIAGHVNWRPATYDGPIFWVEQAWADRDYNIDLVPPNGNGLTRAAGSAIKGEFDARETVNHFTHPWWVAFRDAVDSGNEAARAMIDGKRAIVVGLAGTDCEHDCGTELHPVWALAIQTRSDAFEDRWAIFMRNWGNEGYCSRYQHYLLTGGNRLSVSLPWRAGASAVSTTGTQFFANMTGISSSWSAVPGQRVDLSFNLPPPSSRGRVHGELILRWTGARVAAPEKLEDVARPEREEREGSAEARIAALAEGLTTEQRAVYEKALGSDSRTRDRGALPVRFEPAAEKALPVTPIVLSVPDPQKVAEDNRRLEALRKAYGGKLPGPVGEALEPR
jgi:hypothetical protein